jgi:hypothetical protein
MPKLKVDAEDIEALLSLADGYRGERGPGAHFTDTTKTTLRPYFIVAIQNCQTALREQRQRPAPKVAKRSAAHPR